jgi:hypothetical protein
MARRKPVPLAETVSVQSGGQTYWGEYTVEHGFVTLYCEHGCLTAQLCGSPPVVLARRMLCQIVEGEVKV